MTVYLLIDSVLVRKAQKLGRFQTKEQAVTEALKQFVQRQGRAGLKELFGKIDIDEEYDYKKVRTG